MAKHLKQKVKKSLIGKFFHRAQYHIQNDSEYSTIFEPYLSYRAFIMAIDIRNSTELLLNANTPEDFASFLTGLCVRLKELIIANGGIFDKFTGDGVIAFFPESFFRRDAGYRVLLAASQAISFFETHYSKNRDCFNIVTVETGLGVGIDFGSVLSVKIGDSLSVVGKPVVYACRLSGAPAGSIYLNQPAQENITKRYKAHTIIKEKVLLIKKVGNILAYDVRLKDA